MRAASMAPGLHYYTIIVDGAEVSDPGSTAYFGGSKWASAVEVPEAGVDYYLAKDVPHGQVREIWYHSSVTGTCFIPSGSICVLSYLVFSQSHSLHWLQLRQIKTRCGKSSLT